MVDVAFHSLIELLTGFSTSVTMLLILRTLFGVGMGGEWGIGSIPAHLSELSPTRPAVSTRG